ncbi:hypothetical protein BDD21_2632 [Thiocapsa rosea]|uniref:Uncharacterized protein n=1 Tax=Thiocapsa rosea TaxID=69360 RepID=A0A495V9B6_9GAMM|nr:hypothetical protein BDD21_2632 [Thiocapsa rosea]
MDFALARPPYRLAPTLRAYSLPRSAWECRRDAPRPCRDADAHPRRCDPCRHVTAPPRDAERRDYTPTRSVGASWLDERGSELPYWLAPTLRVGVSSGRSASLPPCRRAPPPVRPAPCTAAPPAAFPGALTRSHAPRGSVAGTLRVPAAMPTRTPGAATRVGTRPRRHATQSVGASWLEGRGSELPYRLAPTLRVGVSPGRSASLPPCRRAPPPVRPAPMHGRAPRGLPRRVNPTTGRADR